MTRVMFHNWVKFEENCFNISTGTRSQTVLTWPGYQQLWNWYIGPYHPQECISTTCVNSVMRNESKFIVKFLNNKNSTWKMKFDKSVVNFSPYHTLIHLPGPNIFVEFSHDYQDPWRQQLNPHINVLLKSISFHYDNLRCHQKKWHSFFQYRRFWYCIRNKE